MAELIQQQIIESGPTPAGVRRASNLILPPPRAADRLRHFPEEVYDLNPESHLARLIKVLLGDAGAGQLRKRLAMVRLQQTLQGSHFFDLDHFYGALFGFRRKVAELLTGNPYVDVATADVWIDQHRKDASYRSRITQFARAINFGGTPTGVELAAEAVLSVDVDVYESYSQSDSGYRTYAEIEASYADYSEMEGVFYSDLEGLGLPVISGNDRREFVIWPKRPITLEEAYDVQRVVDRIKPADARFRIDSDGAILHAPITIKDAEADSNYWEIETLVSTQGITEYDPYVTPANTPVEQPRPPFSGYQGEAWSYVNDVSALTTYAITTEGNVATHTQRVSFLDGFQDYPPEHALTPVRSLRGGRSASDGILVSHFYAGNRRLTDTRFGVDSGALAPLYSDRIPVDALVEAIDRSPEVTGSIDPTQRFFVTPERTQDDPTVEVIELRLSSPRLVNYLSLEVSRFPHILEVQYLGTDGLWHNMLQQSVVDSSPSILSLDTPRAEGGHPQHSLASHWLKCSAHIDAVEAQQFRVHMTRGDGIAPRYPRLAGPAPYSLAVRSLDLGYRITSRADVPSTEVIGTSTDVFGSTVQFKLREDDAANILDDDGLVWRCEPQAVNYAVVNLHLDMGADAPVVDRFYLDPTHPGAHLSLYWSRGTFEPGPHGGSWVDAGAYEDMEWVPVPRDYTLQKGYIHFPATKARYWKMEFTNLVAEPYESFLPITRQTKLFPAWVVDQTMPPASATGQALPQGVTSAIALAERSRYADAVTSLSAIKNDSEAYYIPNPVRAGEARKDAWFFGFAPWSQGDRAPRWMRRGTHDYDVIEVRHDTKTAFFVGLHEVRAYRVQYDAQEDTPQYREMFFDTDFISDVGDWYIDTGAQAGAYIYSDEDFTPTLPTDLVSKNYESRHGVRGIQFATQQTEPIQIVPDDNFTDPDLAFTDWSDQDRWHGVGDMQLVYSPIDQSVIAIRNVDLPPRPINRTSGVVQPVVLPPFYDRPFTVEDFAAIEASFGGLESGSIPLTAEGRVVGAARVLLESDLTSPLVIQILSNASGEVLAEKEITGSKGELLEWWIEYEIGTFYIPPPPVASYEATSAIINSPVHVLVDGRPVEVAQPPPPTPTTDDVVRVRLLQRGDSNDRFRIQRLSLFDEGILWDFSVDGGQTWRRGNAVRNDANGVIVFQNPGTSLIWRARATRSNVGVQNIQIRPWYVGRQNARVTFQHRGPNVSVFDQVPPITEDPEFNSWMRPVPRWWFWEYRGFSLLNIEGIPNVGPSSRFFARYGSEIVTPPIDGAVTPLRAQANMVEVLPTLSDSVGDGGGSQFHRTGHDHIIVYSSDPPLYYGGESAGRTAFGEKPGVAPHAPTGVHDSANGTNIGP